MSGEWNYGCECGHEFATLADLKNCNCQSRRPAPRTDFTPLLIALLLALGTIAWASLHNLGQHIDAVGHGMERMMPDTVPASPPTTPGLIGCDCRRVP